MKMLTKLATLLTFSPVFLVGCSSDGTPDSGDACASGDPSCDAGDMSGGASGSGGATGQSGGAFSGGATGGGTATGGSANAGGTFGSGGASSSSGGTSQGVGGTAGVGGGFGSGGAAGSGGAPGAGGSPGSGGGSAVSEIFDECRFHFGVTREYAIQNQGIRDQIDFFVPGWMGVSPTFDQGYVCDDVKGTLAGKVPVVVAYVAAFYAKNTGLNDCNVGMPDLCTHGASIIKNNLSAIVDVYESYAQGYANCLPPGQPILFKMEPDFYQYTISQQTNPMTPQEAGNIMGQFVQAIRERLPNAHFSMDISPWVPPNNGSDNGADWFSNFDLSPFSLINTSGGGTEADNTRIRQSNNMTWSGVYGVTGKPIIADTGYGVNGQSEGHDYVWDQVGNINARIADGVVGLAQYNPEPNWGSTIANIRNQLDTPSSCP